MFNVLCGYGGGGLSVFMLYLWVVFGVGIMVCYGINIGFCGFCWVERLFIVVVENVCKLCLVFVIDYVLFELILFDKVFLLNDCN